MKIFLVSLVVLFSSDLFFLPERRYPVCDSEFFQIALSRIFFGFPRALYDVYLLSTQPLMT